MWFMPLHNVHQSTDLLFRPHSFSSTMSYQFSALPNDKLQMSWSSPLLREFLSFWRWAREIEPRRSVQTPRRSRMAHSNLPHQIDQLRVQSSQQFHCSLLLAILQLSSLEVNYWPYCRFQVLKSIIGHTAAFMSSNDFSFFCDDNAASQKYTSSFMHQRMCSSDSTIIYV